MREGKGDDTRKLLKAFGIAVTDFERESEEILDRVRSLEKEAGGDLVAELRDLLELIADSGAKWQRVTEHVFETQRRVLADVLLALPK